MRGEDPIVACEICGQPTTGKYGTCRRTPECLSEGAKRRRRWMAEHPGARTMRVSRPCEVCGQQTTSKSGICSRAGKCKSASRGHVPQEATACEICGRPTTSVFGVCRQTKECARVWARRSYAAADPAVLAARAKVNGQSFRKRRASNPEPYRASNRRWYAANSVTALRSTRRYHAAHPDVLLAIKRRFMARADRPCRYAKAGCTEFAVVGQAACKEHQRADRKRYKERRRARLTTKLALAQDWICPWCDKPLPDDLTGVHIDHIIPKASGFIIEDEWNLQVLHHPCNARKFDKITARALTLAAEHGIPLAAAPNLSKNSPPHPLAGRIDRCGLMPGRP